MAGIVVGNGTAASAEATVDTNGNLHVRTPQTESQAGFAQLSCEIDAGTLTGSRYVKALEASTDYRLRTGVDQTLFNLSFEGTVTARDRFFEVDNTLVAAQAGGFLTLNSAAAVTANTNVRIQSYRTFPLHATYTLYGEFWAKPINETATNSLTEFGFGYATAGATPTDGVFFRYNAASQLLGVCSYGGSETTINLASPTTAETHHYLIAIHNEEVEFWIDDILCGEVPTPTANPAPMQANSQPIFARVYTVGGASSLARQFSIGYINVTLGDMNTGKLWGHVLNGMGNGSYQIQPGTTSGPTVTRGAAQTGWPTSGTAQTAGTFTATSAPAFNTMGGYYLTPAMSTLTANADYPVYSYLNPAGTATLPGKTLYITGARIGEVVVVAAAVAATQLVFAIGIGSTASATTATEGIATVAARLVPVGIAGILAADIAGQSRGGWTLDFSHAPLACPPNTYVQLIMRPLVITAVALTYVQSVTFTGYFE